MNGIAILGALPGSPAEENGLKYGDLLLSVNGIAMTSVEDFLQARASAEGTMELLVRRDSHVMEITLDVSKGKARKIDAGEAMATVNRLSLVPPLPDDTLLN